MAPRNFLLESSIFQISSSSDLLFFLENPHLTVILPQNCMTLAIDSLNTKTVI